MNIPNDKIEDMAVRAIEALADENTALVPRIAAHDKDLSYDGYIELYRIGKTHNKESYEDRIFVQVKGHIDDKEEYINKQRISYPVSVADLKVYSQKEGVVYFQVFITSDGRKKELFYSSLYSSRIKSYLGQVKDNQKEKSITFTKMKKTGDELYSVMMQFSKESKLQGSIHTQTVENMISLKELSTLKEIHFEAVAVRNEFDVLRRLSAGDVCVYGRVSDMPYRFPIEWNDGNRFYVSKKLPIPIRVNDIEYYESIEVSRGTDEAPGVAKFSDNLSFEIATARFVFRAVSGIEEIRNDVGFLRAVIQNRQFQFADKMQETPNIIASTELEKSLEFFEDLSQVLTDADIKIEKRLESFSDEEVKAITKLVSIKRGECNKSLPEKITHFDWKFDEKYYPLVIHIMDDGTCAFKNAIYDTHNMFYLTDDEEHYYRVVSFGYLEKEVVENLYLYDAKRLQELIEKADVNDVTRDTLNIAVLRMIQAYDSCHDFGVLSVAQNLCVKLQNGSPLYKINELQIKARSESLSDEDINTLDEIINDCDLTSVVCAAHIIKGNMKLAKDILSKLDEDERKMIEEWPIFTLMK
ncbi:MAG: DUF4365 domain-containing protein [Lachnospiraceae bacterium]|nr:DUF4365 domain-containing protein [Lachnospiraceae bacterium]